MVTGGERSDEADSDWLAGLGGQGGPLVANAWGQTETGGAVLFSPLPQGPGSLPDPGVAIVDGSGAPVRSGSAGELVLRHPWPGLFVDVEGHADVDGRYWRYGPSAAWTYATGDLARLDTNGEVEIIRRLDPAVKVSGQLVSLADIAEVLEEHPLVEEAIAVQTLDAEGGRSMLGCVGSPTRRPRRRMSPTTCAAMSTSAWAGSPGRPTSPSSNAIRSTCRRPSSTGHWPWSVPVGRSQRASW